AEDGIRDLIVTGVQTCALPISNQVHIVLPVRDREGPGGARPVEESDILLPVANGEEVSVALGERLGGRSAGPPEGGQEAGMGHRSEERRVGKEGRERGAPV